MAARTLTMVPVCVCGLAAGWSVRSTTHDEEADKQFAQPEASAAVPTQRSAKSTDADGFEATLLQPSIDAVMATCNGELRQAYTTWLRVEFFNPLLGVRRPRKPITESKGYVSMG